MSYISKESLEQTVTDELLKMDRFSSSAVLAIMMIIAHESQRGKYWRQVGGPAIGLIQMEAWVHDDVWEVCDSIKVLAEHYGVHEDVEQLAYDIRYNIFMARCRLLMDVRPLPTNKESMAEYLKEYWNSGAGKASAEKYLNDYEAWK